MFVGHYGPSLAAKALDKSIPLWVLFLAVQLVDIFWAIFVLLGIEKVRIVPGITATNPLDLYYMPYTHSLVAAVLWSILAMIVFRAIPKFKGRTAALIIAVIAFLLEAVFLFGGMYYYLRTTRPLTSGGRYGMVAFGIVMLGIQSLVFFGPPPPSEKAPAVMALASYFVFAWVAYRLERKRH
jgi:hypothetical protein